MKFLYFHQHFSTPSGSTGIRSYEMARYLISQGHSVTIVCGSYGAANTGLVEPYCCGKRQGLVDGINIIEFDLAYANSHSIPKRISTFVKFAVLSLWLALTLDYDVLFSSTTPLTAGVPGIAARWLRRKPFVFEVRDLWPELPRAMKVVRNPLLLWAMELLEFVSYRSAHRLIGLSPGIVKGIESKGVPSHRIAMIPNGCDLDIFDADVTPLRPDGIDRSDFLAIFAGTHGVANGLAAILDTAAELKRRGRQDIKILLIGQGKCKPQLQIRAQNEGLDNVVFHSPVNKQKLSEFMAGANIGLQVLANYPAFYYGTSPNKFFDYIAAGLPVLNNYPGWLAELIDEYKCGLVVPPDSPNEFADALVRAADSRDEINLMGSRALTLAKSEFSRDKLAMQWGAWVTGVKY